MMINDEKIYQESEAILRKAYGENARFRDGQYEAIEAVATKKRTIVVQKTGWGKSLVYFVAAKLFRKKGITIVISPLLVLMDNQKEAAERIGLECRVLNSSVKDKEERQRIIANLRNGECDVFFTTPETLYGREMQDNIKDLNIALFVIDECHCISDWGHDFRLEYGKLNKIISKLPPDVAVLGTTATANDRVIDDLKKQFGENVYVSRGSLTRKSLHIEILNLNTKAQRYAWLEKNLNKIPGSGIIYCITQNDCNRLSEFLNKKGISAKPYHSGDELKDEIAQIQEKFQKNEIKVLVATIKLGMGYDKSDIGFVIHFQRPSSLVAYYQQIGRAGRSENMEAYCYLMTGDEDREINEYFIENAFPTFEQECEVVNALNDANGGLSLSELQLKSNISSKALKRSMMFLMNQGVIYYDPETKKYNRSVHPYHYMGDYYEKIKESKISELDELEEYIQYDGCLSKYVVNALNDNTAYECGKCANCLKKGILDGVGMSDEDDVIDARHYLESLYFEIKPRLKWKEKENPFDANSKISKPNEPGLALAKYNDAGYGKMVAQDKYHADCFGKDLVDKAVEVLKEKLKDQGYSIVTNIPSGRNHKVYEFAKQVAKEMGYEYRELLDVTGCGEQQKMMQNAHFQYHNALNKLRIKEDGNHLNGANIVLIDDLVDSKWTLTVAGGLLHKAGAQKVYPFCLADSSQSEG